MFMHFMASIYANLIIKGKRTLEEVPTKDPSLLPDVITTIAIKDPAKYKELFPDGEEATT